jgi:hypothetical protein
MIIRPFEIPRSHKATRRMAARYLRIVHRQGLEAGYQIQAQLSFNYATSGLPIPVGIYYAVNVIKE